MQTSRPQPIYALLAAALLSLAGVAALLLRQRRRVIPAEAPALPAPESAPQLPETPPAPAVIAAPVVRAAPRPLTWRVMIAAVIGGGCLVAAQALLLGSRHPVMPFIVFMIGLALLQPAFAFYARRWQAEPEITPAADPVRTPLRNPYIYWVGGAFFFLGALLLAQTGAISPLLLFCWGMCSFAIIYVALDGTPLLNGERLAGGLAALRNRWPVALILGGLMLLALVMQLTTPPTHDDTPILLLNGLGVVLLVPVTGWLGWRWGGLWCGLIAAAFVVVSGWVLALGKSDGPYVLLALAGGLYVTMLHAAYQTRSRAALTGAGIALGGGMLITPVFGLAGLLLLVMALLAVLDDRRAWRSWVGQALLAAAVALVVAAPALNIAQLVALTQVRYIRANPQLSTLEALSTTLLLFNLTSDPNPRHGLGDRPAFSPVMSAAFIAGLLALAWRVSACRRWRDLLLLAALVLLALPASVRHTLPITYPDSWLAAGVLPVAVVIAAYGAALLLRLPVLLWGRPGAALALLLLTAGLAYTLIDAQTYYAALP